MGFFEDLGNKVSRAGDKIADTARSTNQISQLEASIRSYRYQIDDLFRRLGFVLYTKMKNPDSEEPDYQKLVDSIDQTNDAMNAAKEEYDRIRGITHCDHCGTQIPIGTKFCPNCGQPVEENARFCLHCGSKL